MQTVVFASSNPFKFRELKTILGVLDVTLCAQSEFGIESIAEKRFKFCRKFVNQSTARKQD